MPRLYHTKSKTGCSRCRARRVKCDESKPTCGGCARHNVECVYDRQALTASSLASNSSDAATANLPGAYQPANLKTWTVDVPRLALDFEPLNNMLMVISLDWMICTDRCPEGDLFPEELSRYRAKYLEVVFQEHRKALAQMDDRTAENVSLTSMLLCIDAFANLRERDADLLPYQPPIGWLQMSKGVQSVVEDALDMAKPKTQTKMHEMADGTAPFWDPAHFYTEANRARFAFLLAPREEDKQGREDDGMYDMALTYIGAILNAQETGEDKRVLARRTLIFPMLVPQTFIESVGLCRPRALLILAHFFALAMTSSHAWWVGDSPARELRYIYEYLGPEWHDLMQWPLQMLNRTPSQSSSSFSPESSIAENLR